MPMPLPIQHDDEDDQRLDDQETDRLAEIDRLDRMLERADVDPELWPSTHFAIDPLTGQIAPALTDRVRRHGRQPTAVAGGRSQPSRRRAA